MGLRTLVMTGAVEKNTRLPEVALSERLGVSRTPLRQAMDRLVAEGLLERIETGGARVASFTVDDINDAIELRGVIEGTAARMAAERGAEATAFVEADAAVQALDRILAAETVDVDAYAHHNAAFHDALARMAASSIIQREVERVAQLPLASPTAFLKEQELIPNFLASLMRAQWQHKAILAAIKGREGARAEALTREHARLARENLEHFAKAGPGVATRVPGLSLVTSE
ncbi:MAG: GntR family transcriptional regulator [Boseongicola sp.]|nr:GntR family transcriptional regulator [Boseongicola sp.]